MLRKTVSGIILTLLIVSTLTLAFNIQPARAEPRTWIVDDDGSADYHTIQEAINAASDGDTIIVCSGTYIENVIVNKRLTIKGIDYPVIDGNEARSTVTITADMVILQGFNVTNCGYSGEPFGGGIELTCAENCIITDNNLYDNKRNGISLTNSDYNTIKNNTCVNNEDGIRLWSQSPMTSSNNAVYNNTCFRNLHYGIELWSYIYETTTTNDNNITNNDCSSNQWGGIYVGKSVNGTLSENTCSHNGEMGIFLDGRHMTTKNITVTNNLVSNNNYGIYLWGTGLEANTIAGNTIENNDYGVYCQSVYGNELYHNDFIQNGKQTRIDIECRNIWDDSYPSGGNYWSDYTGIDADGDGIGDAPYIINADNRDRYPLVKPWRWAPTPPPTPTPPIASFTYNPPNPIIDEDITFDASDSYDPDGGTITNYRWEFYRLAEYMPFPLIGIIEGADKEILDYSFSSKGAYLVNLTVTDDEGATNSIDKTVKVWEKWSFAIIADPQIGIGWDGDYGSLGWNDDESGQEYSATRNLDKTVSLINSNVENYNIAFVVVLGDLSDSAEMSEFNKGVEILSRLKVPWIPVMGNHDVWPHVSNEDEADEETPDWYFHDIFKTQYESLSENNLFQNWTPEPVPVQNPETGKWYYFQNFAFDYKGYHFVGLDFNSRDPPPLPWMPGVEAWAHLYDFESGTWNWFKEHFDAYADKGNENTIIFSHHPMDFLPFTDFSWDDYTKIWWDIYSNNWRNNIWGNFAGHIHYNSAGYDTLSDMHIVTTRATFKEPLTRIVQVSYDKTVDFSTVLRGEQKGMWITTYSPVDLVVTDPDGLTISKESNEIQGALYLEDDINEDGLPEDFIAIPERKIGDYRITVIPELGAAPTDTYSLEVSGEDATTILAENVPISDMPTQPYVFNSAALDIPPTTQLTTGEPKFVVNGITYLTSDTHIALVAEDNPGGSGVASTVYRIYNATYDRDWITYTQPFYLSGLSDGAYSIDYYSKDYAGNIEPTGTITVVLDNTSPATTLTLGEPKYVTEKTYVASETSFILEADDNIGSGVYSIAYRLYNSAYDSGWLPYTTPFYLAALADGVYTIEFNSTDNVGNVETSNTATVILDNTEPLVAILNPPSGWALQDGVTFVISAIDAGSGVSSVNFSIHEVNGGEGTPVGFEDLPASYNATTGEWTIFFDTLQLPDGYYVVLVKAKDNLGNTGSTIVPYSIRNWAVIELLPASKPNKAGRTMPVKFSLRVAASVDPNQPFVYNEELTIQIYDINDPSNILQTSTFGDTARDYRISTVDELYITNFQTLKTPKTYVVEIYRKQMLIGNFEFTTVK